MKYLLTLVILCSTSCTQLSGICPGNEPGQYFVVKNQSFLLFNMNYVIELRKLYYTGKVWPAVGTSVREDPSAEEAPSKPEPKAPPKKQPRKKEGEDGWWG